MKKKKPQKSTYTPGLSYAMKFFDEHDKKYLAKLSKQTNLSINYYINQAIKIMIGTVK